MFTKTYHTTIVNFQSSISWWSGEFQERLLTSTGEKGDSEMCRGRKLDLRVFEILDETQKSQESSVPSVLQKGLRNIRLEYPGTL